MKAIFTKYIGPTNTKRSRVKAYDLDGNQVTIPFDTDTDDEEAYRKAAEALCEKMKWPGKLASGGTKKGYVFVFVK